MWYLTVKLTIPGVESPIILALIKMLVNSLYFTMAELTRTGSWVPGYIDTKRVSDWDVSRVVLTHGIKIQNRQIISG